MGVKPAPLEGIGPIFVVVASTVSGMSLSRESSVLVSISTVVGRVNFLLDLLIEGTVDADMSNVAALMAKCVVVAIVVARTRVRMTAIAVVARSRTLVSVKGGLTAVRWIATVLSAVAHFL